MTPVVHTVAMSMTDTPGRERPGRRRSHRDDVIGTSGWEPAWRPLARASLLDHIRVTGRPRPGAAPDLAAELWSLLDSGIADRPAIGDDERLVVTKDRLTQTLSCPVHRTVDRFGDRSFNLALACGALVDVLFRQIVTVGSVGDPMADALDGLAMDGRQDGLVAWIGGLSAAELAELRSEVDRQAHGLAERWPALDPSWLPRTQESIRALLTGGRVELSARVDLAIGPPADAEASVAIVEVKSGACRPEHGDDLRFYALIETLRTLAPPFVVATYYARTGELDVEPVTRELLLEAARRCRAGIRLLGGAEAEPGDAAWCAGCAAHPQRATEATVPTEGTGPVPGRGRRADGAPIIVMPHGRAA